VKSNKEKREELVSLCEIYAISRREQLNRAGLPHERYSLHPFAALSTLRLPAVEVTEVTSRRVAPKRLRLRGFCKRTDPCEKPPPARAGPPSSGVLARLLRPAVAHGLGVH